MDHSCNLTIQTTDSQHPGLCSTTVQFTNIFVATGVLSNGVTASFPQQLSGWCITSMLFPRVYVARCPPFALNLLSLKTFGSVNVLG